MYTLDEICDILDCLENEAFDDLQDTFNTYQMGLISKEQYIIKCGDISKEHQKVSKEFVKVNCSESTEFLRGYRLAKK